MKAIACKMQKALDRLGPRGGLGVVFVLALALRLASSSTWSSTLSYATFPFLDEMDYDSLARNMLDFGIFGAFTEGHLMRSLRPPTYPVFLASVYAVLGRSFVVVRILQALLDSCSAVLLALIASNLRLRRGICLLTALAYALYGPAIHMGAFLTGETLALFLLNLSVLTTLLSGRTGRRWFPITSAVLLGLLIHCRPAFLGVIPFWVVSVFLVMPRERRTRGALTFAVAVVLMLAPWATRNLLVHHRLVPVSTVPAWHVFSSCQGHDLLRIGEGRERFFSLGHLTEGELYAFGVRVGLKHLAAHPLACFAGGMARIAYSWTFPDCLDRFWRPRAYVNMVRAGPVSIPTLDFEGLFYLSAVLVAVALFRIRKTAADLRRLVSATAPIWLIVLGYVLFHFLSIPLIQYRFMVEPYTMMLMIAFAFCALGFSPCEPAEASPARGLVLPRWVPSAALAALVALTCLATVGLHRFRAAARRKTAVMSSLLSETRGPRITAIRAYQFEHKGHLDQFIGAEVSWVGEMVYPARNCTFNPTPTLAHNRPEPCAASGVFRLEIDRYAPGTPLGIGDVRVNVPDGALDTLEGGALVQVVGRVAGMTCYGATVVNAEKVIDRSARGKDWGHGVME